MTANPVVVRADQPIRIALEKMEAHTCKHLPVLSRQGHLIGVISDRDIRYALDSPFALRDQWRDESLANELEVRAVMSAAPIIVEPQAPAAEAARLMLTHRIGCLPVMRGETLVGIITRSDILVAFMTMQRRYELIAGSNKLYTNGTNPETAPATSHPDE